MRYFTRYFKDSFRPYHFLDLFEIYDEAEKYDDGFYTRLLNKRKQELAEENTGVIDCTEQYMFSIQYTSCAWTLLSVLPVHIQDKIVDTRVFFLYAITQEVYELICKEKDEQDKNIRRVIEDYEHHKIIDLEKAPKHWKQIFEIDFMEALLVKLDFVGLDLNMKISTDGREDYEITLRDIQVLYNETNITTGVIYYAEILLNKNNLEINFLTNFNEISILAKDIDIHLIK